MLNKKYTILRNILIDNGLVNEIPKRIFYVWGANEPKRDDVKKCIITKDTIENGAQPEVVTEDDENKNIA